MRILTLGGLVFLALITACTQNTRLAAATEDSAASGSPLIGLPAPDFTLPDDGGGSFHLREWRGHWLVIYFYPQDDTPGCTCQATEFTRLLTRFGTLDATIVGISPDTRKSHNAFRQKYGLTLTLLSDPDHAVAAVYGAWNQMGFTDRRIGRINRTTLLIDPEGRIAWHWPEVIPEGHADRVRRKLADLRANWKPRGQ